MKFGEVFDYRTAEEANAFIGKKGVFSDSLWNICEIPTEVHFGTLVKVDADGKNAYPFMKKNEGGNGVPYGFFRPVLEEEERMSHRQLAEWLSKGNGEYSYETSSMAFMYWQYCKGDEDKPVEGYILIRRWADTEWMKPTKAIYEEDCK